MKVCHFAVAVLSVGLLPIEGMPSAFFSPNRGQAPPEFLHLLRTGNLSAAFKADGVQFQIGGGDAAVSVYFEGSSARIVEPSRLLPGVINLLTGSDPHLWRSGIPTYASLTYRDLYPGIDAIYDSSDGHLKCEFRVAAKGNPSLIRLSYRGMERIAVDADGALILATPSGLLREEPPHVYQRVGGVTHSIPGAFRLEDLDTVSFDIGHYDRSQPLIIDPAISVATYFGGSQADVATGVAVDAAGNVYVAGWTESSDLASAPIGFALGVNAFVAKFRPDGRTLIYCTYIGGAGNDQALGLTVDSLGNAFVTGWTSSRNFPVEAPLQSSLAGLKDAFIAKLNPSGDALLFSTYFGGSTTESGNAVALDSAGNVYVAGETTSTSGFRTANPLQPHLAGGTDGFVLKMDITGSSLLYATYFGGSGNDRARAIAVNAQGEAYITGDTASADFPKQNAFQPIFGGNQDAFAAKLNASGSGLVFATYLGGSGGMPISAESGTAIAVDLVGNAYLTGTTASQNFPLVNATASFNGSTEVFLCKMSAAGVVHYSSYVGGTAADTPNAIAISSMTGSVYVVGYTGSVDLPGAGASESSHQGLYDAFVMQFGQDGKVVQSQYIGGSGIDVANAVAVAAGEQLYVAGQTGSANFTVANAVQEYLRGQMDSFLVRITIRQSAGLHFVPITPCRVIDTRLASGTFGGPALAGGSTRNVPIPSGTCNIPAAALAYSLNLTAIPHGRLGYLTLWPAGQARPIASTLNSFDGRVKANAAIVAAGINGSVSVFGTDATDFLIDVNGYFVPAGTPAALAFYPVTPCRVMDSRAAPGPLAGPSLTPKQVRQIPVRDSSCGVPANAAAYSLNITAIPKTTLSYLSTWPGGAPIPGGTPAFSTLNAFTGKVTANAAIVPAGVDGSIALYATDASDVVIDVNGYFAQHGLQGLAFWGLTPCRAVDTRDVGPLGGSLVNGMRDFPITSGPCELPASAKAFVFNATVIPRGSLDFLTLWPTSTTRPVASTLNAFDGSVTSNNAIVPTINGSVSAFVAGQGDLILDAMGYFAP